MPTTTKQQQAAEWPAIGETVSVTLYGVHHVGQVQPHQPTYSHINGIPVTLDNGQTLMFFASELHPIINSRGRVLPAREASYTHASRLSRTPA